MSFSILSSLDQNKLNEKKVFIEYSITFDGNDQYHFFINESECDNFLHKFKSLNINSKEKFSHNFPDIILHRG